MFVTGGLQNLQIAKEFGGQDYTLVEPFSGTFRLKMGVRAVHGCVQYMGKNGMRMRNLLIDS